jgi:uncharacterized protein YciI
MPHSWRPHAKCAFYADQASPPAMHEAGSASSKRRFNVFIVSLAYIKPIDVVELHLPAHREFLHRNYAAGVFLLSGPKEPRTGGVILANLDSREELQAVLDGDPFHQHDVAEYTVTRFTATMAAPSLQWLLPAST